jgi:hypothetical protein
LQLGLDLFESLGGHLFVERGEDGLALGRRQIFQNVGQVGGVHLGQPLVLDAQLDAPRRIDLDDVDKLPGNAAAPNLRESVSSVARGSSPLKTRRKAPRSPTSTSATRSRCAAPWPIHSRSTSFTRTTLRP